MRLVFFFLSFLFFKNTSALEIFCKFEEVYQNGEIQQGDATTPHLPRPSRASQKQLKKVTIGRSSSCCRSRNNPESAISHKVEVATASAGSAVEADTTAVGSCSAVEYTIFVSNSTNIQSQKVLIMDNGTTAYIQEFAAMSNPNLIATFSADVNSGLVRLLATPETGISGSTTICNR